MDKVFKIQGSVKNYEWGKIGLNSRVAQLQKSAIKNFIVKEIPYAELWMGTHTSGPAIIPSLQEMKLIDWIRNHPECLGKNITDLYVADNGLPFLFKVLSVNKALSIQVHPDKQTAVKLHEEFPEHYPDSNHKPEMAIAVSEFEALCGFRPLYEIKEFLIAVPQLQSIISKTTFETFVNSPSEENLKFVFTELMTSSLSSFESQLKEIIEGFKANIFKNELCQSISKLFLQIANLYPNDIGCFCLFFLNYLKLRPGESIFLAANEPHAYLSGDCIECMACSDNVVRAGLTPKYKDVTTLCKILTYICKPGIENIFSYIDDLEDPYLKTFNPPVDEFAIDVIELPETCNKYGLKGIDSASILLVMKGTAVYTNYENKEDLISGTILFISANCVINIEPQTHMLLYRAYCSK